MRAVNEESSAPVWLEVENPDDAHVLIGTPAWFESEQRADLSKLVNVAGKVEACWGEQPNVRGKFICLALPVSVSGFRRFLSLIEHRVYALPTYRSEMTGR
jgi:hypothetical protein